MRLDRLRAIYGVYRSEILVVQTGRQKSRGSAIAQRADRLGSSLRRRSFHFSRRNGCRPSLRLISVDDNEMLGGHCLFGRTASLTASDVNVLASRGGKFDRAGEE